MVNPVGKKGIALKKRVILGLCLLMLLAGVSMPAPSESASLKDLIKRPSELFLPTQIIPGRAAVFTLRGKPGQSYQFILSSMPHGTVLPNGVSLRVGKPTVEKTGVVPESGVVQIPVTLSEEVAIPGERQFVDAVVWTRPDKSDAQPAQMIEHTGIPTSANAVVVVPEPDKGNMLLIPGDPGMSSLFRTLETLNQTSTDPRKKELLYEGDIDRSRYLDRNLQPGGTPAIQY